MYCTIVRNSALEPTHLDLVFTNGRYSIHPRAVRPKRIYSRTADLTEGELYLDVRGLNVEPAVARQMPQPASLMHTGLHGDIESLIAC